MKQIEYKTAMVEQKVPYIEKIICDRCKKILHKSFGEEFINKTDECHPLDMASWYRVTTGHNDWENDSCESVRRSDICLKCITDVYDEYVERSRGLFNTEYLEIEHCYGMSLPFDESEMTEIYSDELIKCGKSFVEGIANGIAETEYL